MANENNSVTFVHPEYSRYINNVAITRNVFEGIDSTTQYILKLERESEESILRRRNSATLKNFVKRAIEAFVGMIFRKQIETTGMDERLLRIMDSIDRKRNLNIFSRDIATNLILDGVVYVGVDSDKYGEKDPYAVMYYRNQLINWRVNDEGNYTLMVIKEVISVPDGEFGTITIDQYRVYKEDGNIDIYRPAEEGEYYIYEQIETEYDYIPIVAIKLDDIPPLYDIAKLTIKHTNRTSVKDKYLDMCATPIPIVWSSDVGNDDGDLTKPVYVIGADEGFQFNGTKDECDFEWRELTGTSIDKLQEDLSVIEEDITTGIIKASSSESAVEKTATQMYYESSESANRVIVIANQIEYGLNKVFKILADIANVQVDNEARIIINKDFNSIADGSDGSRLLWEIYLQGGLSTETFLDALAKDELVDIGSVYDEMERIKKDNFVLKPKTSTVSATDNMDNRTVSAINNSTKVE